MNKIGNEYNEFNIIVGEPEIGKDTWVGYFCMLDGSGGLKIGRHCAISSGVHIYSHDAIRWATENLEKDHVNWSHVDRSPVVIGDNVFIGAGTIILRGVIIGNGAIIGAGSLVLGETKIGENEVWAGSPAHFIKNRV